MQKHDLFLKRETVLGIKAVKLPGQKKQLNCCGLKGVKERMKWEGLSALVLNLKFITAKGRKIDSGNLFTIVRTHVRAGQFSKKLSFESYSDLCLLI